MLSTAGHRSTHCARQAGRWGRGRKVLGLIDRSHPETPSMLDQRRADLPSKIKSRTSGSEDCPFPRSARPKTRWLPDDDYEAPAVPEQRITSPDCGYSHTTSSWWIPCRQPHAPAADAAQCRSIAIRMFCSSITAFWLRHSEMSGELLIVSPGPGGEICQPLSRLV